MSSRRHIEYLPVVDVVAAERNPKGHDEAGIDASLGAFGYTEPILLDERTGRLVAGHGRLQALARAAAKAAGKSPKAKAAAVPDGIIVDDEGRWLVPVVRGWASLSDAHAEAYLVASNRLTERGGWDERALAALLGDIDVADPNLLAATGYSDTDLAGLLERLAAGNIDEPGGPGGDGGGNPAPVLAGEPTSKEGDVWLLGPHKLAVGDATDPALWRRLMGGADDGLQASLLWTDPPYGVEYVGKTAAALRITADNADDAPVLLADALEALRPYLAPGSHFYVAYPLDPAELGNRFRAALDAAPWRYKQTLVWVKDRFVLGHVDHHYRHEQVAFGRLVTRAQAADETAHTAEGEARVAAVAARLTAWEAVGDRVREAAELVDAGDVDGANELLGLAYEQAHEVLAYGQLTGRAGRRGRGGAGWYGGNAATTVFEIPRPSANVDHPTPQAARPGERARPQLDPPRPAGPGPVRWLRLDPDRLRPRRPDLPHRRARPGLRRRDLPALAGCDRRAPRPGAHRQGDRLPRAGRRPARRAGLMIRVELEEQTAIELHHGAGVLRAVLEQNGGTAQALLMRDVQLAVAGALRAHGWVPDDDGTSWVRRRSGPRR